MMDRDVPISPRERRITVICFAIALVIGALLFGGYLPGLHPQYGSPTYLTVDGRAYYWTATDVPVPAFALNYSFPLETTFHNVSFWYWITNVSFLDTAQLHGNATVPNGSTFDFEVGSGHPLGTRTTEYIAPGGVVAVLWDGGIQFDLLVLV